MEEGFSRPAFVYIVRCADGSLYTGWTHNLTCRIQAHNHAASGAKYTRNRRPVTLVYAERCDSKSLAMSREVAIKRLTRAQKLKLIGWGS